MMKKHLENISFFSINRLVYKYLMSKNNITNILLILKNETYLNKEYNSINQCKIFSNFSDIEYYRYPDRLSYLLNKNYFKSGSLLFAIKEEKTIVAFTWFNTNFDPNGDVSLLNIKNYHIAGPTFVDFKHRGKGLSGKLKNCICAYAKQQSKFPIYAVNSFDNLPIIKNNLREGYKLSNVIIKQKDSEPIIL